MSLRSRLKAIEDSPYLIAAIIAGVGLFHVLTLFAPLPSVDDAGFADYALHGHFQLWESLLPRSLQRYENIFGFGSVPGWFWLIRSFIHLFGMGLWQTRLFSCLSGVFALLLLVALIRRLKLSSPCYYAVFLFALSNVFFIATHSIRQESFILCLILAEALCLSFRYSRWMSIGMGFAGTFAMAFSPTAIFALTTMPVFWWFSPSRKERLFLAWWLVGAIGGFIGVASWIDIDQFVQYTRLVSGVNFLPPPIFFWAWNIPAIIFEWILYLARTTISDPLRYVSVWMSLTSITVCLRHWKRLSSGERYVLCIAISLSVSFALLSGSISPSYFLFFIPWFLLGTAIMYSYLDDPEFIQIQDIFLAATWGVVLGIAAFGSAMQNRVPLFWVTPLSFFCLSLWLKLLPRVQRGYQWFSGGVILLGCFPYPWFPMFTLRRLALLAQQYPLWGLVGLIGPFVLGQCVNMSEKKAIKLGPVLARPMALLLIPICFLGASLGDLWSEIKTIRLSSRATSQIIGLANESLLYDQPLLPGFFIFYRKNMKFRSLDNLCLTQGLQPSFNVLQRIWELKPSYIVWPSSQLDLLEKRAAKSPSLQQWMQQTYPHPEVRNIPGISLFILRSEAVK